MGLFPVGLNCHSFKLNVQISISHLGSNIMTIHIEIIPVLSIIAGILILVKPSILNYVVAIYLIIIGLIQIFGLRF